MLSRVLSHAWIGLVAVLVAVSVLAACKSDGNGGANTANNGGGQVIMNSNDGVDVYLRSCARCHGTNREGAVDAPALDSVRMASLGDDALRNTISYGKGRMPAFGGLSPIQVDALINYLRGIS
jgi:mono/diheme cytochrome c family protein